MMLLATGSPIIAIAVPAAHHIMDSRETNLAIKKSTANMSASFKIVIGTATIAELRVAVIIAMSFFKITISRTPRPSPTKIPHMTLTHTFHKIYTIIDLFD